MLRRNRINLARNIVGVTKSLRELLYFKEELPQDELVAAALDQEINLVIKVYVSAHCFFAGD